MKYTVEIEIDQPVDRVIELFDNPDNMAKWQPGLQSFEHISGEPGQPGAKSKLKYKMGKRDVEMIETITVRDLPREFSGTYEVKGVFNIVRNFFESLPGDRTKWVSENEFQCTGLFMRLMSFLMPGAFRKESMKHLVSFKKFAENKKNDK